MIMAGPLRRLKASMVALQQGSWGCVAQIPLARMSGLGMAFLQYGWTPTMPGGQGELGEAVIGGLTGGRGFMQALLVQAQKPLVQLQSLHPSSDFLNAPLTHSGLLPGLTGLTVGRLKQSLLVQAQRPLVHLQLLHPSSAILVSPSVHAGVSEHGPCLAMVNSSFLFLASQAAISKAHLFP